MIAAQQPTLTVQRDFGRIQAVQRLQQATRLWNLDALRRFSMEELLRFPAALLQADRALKTGGEPRAVVQRLLRTLTEKA